MEKTKPKRKRQAKPKVENYYKILGVRSNAKPERIKESYIQLVKQYPPERYPEEFQRIRKAYETLRDPVKREEYDLLRKFGGSLEKIMDEAIEYMEQENWEQAEKLFLKVVNISPGYIGARIGLAQLQLMKHDLDEFEKHMQMIFEQAESEENEVKVLGIKAKLLIDMDYPERALDVLNLLNDRYPEYIVTYMQFFIQVFQALDRDEEAMKMFESVIPSVEAQKPDDIFLFIEWINAMMELEMWQVSDKIRKRVRKFFKSIKDDDDKLMVTSSFIDEFEAYFSAGMFREAEMYMDLLYSFDPKHPLVLEKRRDVKEVSRIHKEIDRMVMDEGLFPLVSMQALEWFFEEFSDLDVISEYKNMIPLAMLEELEFFDDDFAAGIKRIKKKYPLTYRRYKEKWDELLEEKTSGLNRESRR